MRRAARPARLARAARRRGRAGVARAHRAPRRRRARKRRRAAHRVRRIGRLFFVRAGAERERPVASPRDGRVSRFSCCLVRNGTSRPHAGLAPDIETPDEPRLCFPWTRTCSAATPRRSRRRRGARVSDRPPGADDPALPEYEFAGAAANAFTIPNPPIFSEEPPSMRARRVAAFEDALARARRGRRRGGEAARARAAARRAPPAARGRAGGARAATGSYAKTRGASRSPSATRRWRARASSRASETTSSRCARGGNRRRSAPTSAREREPRKGVRARLR